MGIRPWQFAPGIGQVATAHHAADPVYLSASDAIGESNLLHRKHWEWVFTHATADRLNLLEAGRSALGFGVGTEPLVSAFAARGVEILATDQPEDQAGDWATTGQHSTDLRDLWRPTICDEEVFARAVSFRPVDMTSLPSDLGEFDLVWSSCCFEHLGSPQAGIEFVRNSMRHVAPGGAAIHTTEFDTTRLKGLLEIGDVERGTYACFYRRRDLKRLVSTLRSEGFEVEVDWRVSRRHPAERQVDRPPYSHSPHMRVEVEGRIVTSIGLVVTRPVTTT